MRIARIDGDFAFAGMAGDGWVSAASLGVHAATVAELVPQLDGVAERLAAAPADLPHDAPLQAPVGRPGKILAVGLNYLKHIDELGRDRPERPMIFAKYPSAVVGPQDPIVHNREITSQLDYEVELAVVIGTPARNVSEEDAARHVLGYCVANDVSARDVQRSESQISRSKSLDTFCPIGPWITTADDVSNPEDLAIGTTVNGETRQSSTTGDLLFSITMLVSYLSRTTTLEAGDVILTGTPGGVGSGMKPPTYLNEGDVVCCEIATLGRLTNVVTAP